MAPKPVLLTVDDDPQVLRAVDRDLKQRYGADYRVVRANSGQTALEALETLRQREADVALVLADQRMPEMTGVELLGEVRQRFPDAKRALLTAYADTDAAIAAINTADIDYYLLKPWDPPEEKLYPVLDDLLEAWRAGWQPAFDGPKVYGHRWSTEAHRIRDFLARNLVPYRFFDYERDESACAIAGEDDEAGKPVVVIDGERMIQPSNDAIAEAIGLQTTADQDFYDLVIVGGGPGGLAAAVYAASEGLETVMIEREAPGGQAGTSSRIENYLGFPSGLTGADLARRGVTQARRFGVEILTPREADGLKTHDGYHVLHLDDGSEIACHALLVATGVSYRRLEAPGVDQLTGRGVYYGASITEARSCKDESVAIVGGGNSAGQAAVYFAQHADHVHMLLRSGDLAKSMSQYLVDRIESDEKITVHLYTEVARAEGEERLELLHCTRRDGPDAEAEPMTLDVTGLFTFIGAAPRTDWLGDDIARDRRGFLLAGPDLKAHGIDWPLRRDPYLLETSLPGVFVAGDVRHQSVKRVASAVGEGSIAVRFVHQYLSQV